MALNRRQILMGGLGLGAAAGLSSCAGLTGKSSSDTPSSSSSGSGAALQAELTFVNWSGDAEKKAFDAVIKAFQTANPGITVKTETVPYASVQTNLDSRFQAGNPPDLFRVSYIDIGQYTSQDVLLDVSGTFDQAKVDAFVPGLWQGVVYDGKPYGVPHQIDTTAILYRKDSFEAAGITNIPTGLDDAWTWEEFVEANRKLAAIVKGKQSPFIYDWQSAGAYRWLNWLFQAGGNALGEDLRSPAIDSDQGRKAVEFTQSFFTNEWVPRNSSVKSATYPDSVFIAGTVAMAFAGDFLLPGIETGVKGKFEYGALPMPRDVNAASDLGGNAIVAAKDGKNTEAAARFLEFIVTEEQQRTFCEATGELPTLNALTTSELDFAVRPELMKTFVEQATTITPEQVRQVTVPQFAQINTALQAELEKAFLGGASAADTTAALAAAIEKAAP
ncbi:ABC-type glycerol-3-phosphate transport system, substrate-binding protein [Friedmanniella luteola]|uniref:ABC-type glycerol-3-phosphate transport system, substrate-binding protein n=1 Tax=Friedmanniella luteola TaxID=546871 RepID=A0A1H1WZW5_9ACTN|nr:sugar ABC transporter substrate-binding protein [Friedmanniella luteola]SDT02492.1 ABC-type glycerol-3-phosphate transport system, substrate-binding protein [Friedmanniella luteola]